MSIVRVKRPERFLILPQETARAPGEQGLALDSFGLLVFLLGHPDGWQVRPAHLRRALGVGRDKIRRMLGDLEDAGFLVRRKIRTPSGRMDWESVIFSTSCAGDGFSGHDGSTVAGSPGDGSPGDGSAGHIVSNERTTEPRINTHTRARAGATYNHDVCVEFARKISGGGVRDPAALLATLAGSAGRGLVTDEIAREAAARGGYEGPWPPPAGRRPGPEKKESERAILERHARPGESYEAVRSRLLREKRYEIF